jgi:hypothetical protein
MATAAMTFSGEASWGPNAFVIDSDSDAQRISTTLQLLGGDDKKHMLYVDPRTHIPLPRSSPHTPAGTQITRQAFTTGLHSLA